jgi:hypothetical protein
MPVEQLSEGGARPRIASFVNLREESSPHLLRFARRARTGLHCLGQVVSAAGDRVDPAVDTYAICAAGLPVDAAAERPLLTFARVTSDVTTIG